MATLKELTARVEALEAVVKLLKAEHAAVLNTIALDSGLYPDTPKPRPLTVNKSTGITDAITFASPKEAMAAGKAAAIAGNRVRVQGNTVYYH